jgi:hypothetical protein
VSLKQIRAWSWSKSNVRHCRLLHKLAAEGTHGRFEVGASAFYVKDHLPTVPRVRLKHRNRTPISSPAPNRRTIPWWGPISAATHVRALTSRNFARYPSPKCLQDQGGFGGTRAESCGLDFLAEVLMSQRFGPKVPRHQPLSQSVLKARWRRRWRAWPVQLPACASLLRPEQTSRPL